MITLIQGNGVWDFVHKLAVQTDAVCKAAIGRRLALVFGPVLVHKGLLRTKLLSTRLAFVALEASIRLRLMHHHDIPSQYSGPSAVHSCTAHTSTRTW